MIEKRYEKLGQHIFRETLDNGLTVFVDKRPGYGKQFAFFATHYGGVDVRFHTSDGWQDTPAGVAHFLEHKLFDTEDGNALQLMTASGADPNAFTSFGMTGYFFQSTQRFSENLKTLLRFVSEPYFTAESVAKEQGIIAQEIAMGDDEPDTEVFYDLLNCLYQSHPIRTHIAGTAESISHITPEVLYTCHKAFYNPANMVLVVVGDVDPYRVVALAEEIVTAPGVGSPDRDYGPAEPERPVKANSRRKMAVSAPQFMLGFKLPPPPLGPETLRAQLLGDLAGDLLLGDASDLYAKLYSDGLVTRNFGGGYENYASSAFYAVGGESRDPAAVRTAILDEAARLAHGGISPERFHRCKKAAYGSMVSSLNSFENAAVELAQNTFDGVDYFTFPEVFRTITQEDVATFLGRWFTEPYAALAVVEPEGEGET